MRGTSPVSAVLCALLAAPLLRAQAPDPAPPTPTFTPGTIQFPQAMRPWSTKMALGFSAIAMPSAIAQEGAIVRWPLITYDFSLGLPSHFFLATSFSTEFVTNHLEVAPKWEFAIDERLHGDIGLGVAYWFGRLGIGGYDTNIHGVFLYPQIDLGYDWGTMALTGQIKASYAGSLYTKTGSLVTTNDANWYNGVSFRLMLEQPIWKTTTVGIAIQTSYLKFYYPQWPLFPTFDRYFWIPEAQLRFTL